MSWLNAPYQGGYGQPNQQQQQQQQPQQGYLNPQQTGFPQQLQGQRTGFQQQQPQQQGQYGGGGLRPQMPMQAQPTGYATPPIYPQQTGYNSGYQQQMPQQAMQQQAPAPLQLSNPTGYGGSFGGGVQRQFLSTFMPSSNIQPSSQMNPTQMQFAQQPQGPSLQQSFQQQNQSQTGQASVPIPWALTPDEKKKYDQIFRAWDQQGSGFMSGKMAIEVFGQAGLERDDLMSIWNLADVGDRGKLNIDEFHVAMGLIYRRLNGNPIPETLPAELKPPSARDLSESVDFLSNLLKHDTNSRSTTNSPDYTGNAPRSYAKGRSLHNPNAESNRADATVYRHNDSDTPTYKSSSRHLDRNSVRSGNESPSSDLEDVRNKLKAGQKLLERDTERDDAEQELKDQLRRLKRKIERTVEDLEENRQEPRTDATDKERRALSNKLSQLEYEELPALVKKMEDNEKEKRLGQKKLAMERDARNDKYDKYDDRSRRRRSPQRSIDSDAPRGYQRGSFDEDERDSRQDRDRREDDRSSYRESSARPRTPPPPPAPVAATTVAPPPPPPPVPTSAPAPSPNPDTRSMTPDQRKAHIQEQAQRRIQDRLKALGIASPSSGSTDSSVADRLEQDRVEAQRRAEQADKELEEKELKRQARLEQEKLRGIEIEQDINGRGKAAIEKVREEVSSSSTSRTEVLAAQAQLDKEQQAIAEKEATLLREKEERMARLRALEKEVEEAREAEENFIKNKAKFASGNSSGAAKIPPPPPPSRSRAAPAPVISQRDTSTDEDSFAPPPPRAAVPVLVAPPAPPPPASPPVVPTPPTVSPAVAKSPSTNPFTRLSGAATPTAAPVKTNPFFPANGASSTVPAPQAQPKAVSRPPPSDDDWDSPAGLEKEGSDSSDDEDLGNRNVRKTLAQNLFSMIGLGTPARPPSAQSSSPPPPPGPPPPPAPPAAPRAPSTAADSTPVVPPSALLGQIQGGMRLKATKTKDRSTPASSGNVIGDPSPPVQVYRPPTPTPEPVLEREPLVSPAPVARTEPIVSPPVEPPQPELQKEVPNTLPPIVSDPMDDVDLTTVLRSRTLYAYDGQRSEDLSFGENVVINVNPPKDSESPWAFGTIENSRKSGWIPKAYVEALKARNALALYSYTAASEEEISFEEGQAVAIVDSSDADWWKAEKGGVIGLVPGSYFESLNAKVPTLTVAIPVPQISNDTVTTPDSDGDNDSDQEESSGQSPKRREVERLRVLEAAGLVVLGSSGGRSPAGVKRRATRRVAPARPPRQALPDLPTAIDTSPTLEKDEVQVEEDQLEERMEDAYDIYQRVMRDLPPIPDRTSMDSHPAPHMSPPPSPAPSDRRSSVMSGGFLSRVTGMVRTGSTLPVERRRPIVSGPIVMTTSNRGSFVQTLGSSWASLIDPSALENVPEMERKRQEAIFELIATESTYVQGLQLVIEVFFSALRPVLAEKASEIVFANVEDILMFNTIFLSGLEDRQKTSRLYIDEIGDVLQNHISGLEVYRPYCVNTGNAAQVLSDLKNTDTKLRVLLDGLRVKNLELEHFLLEPVQRLARYPLLIGQILRYTASDHHDHSSLVQSLSIAESVLVAVNEAVREHDSSERLITLSDNLEFAGVDAHLDLTASTRLMGPRKLLREGQLSKAGSGRKLNAYLFNDLLLFTEGKSGEIEYVYRWPIPLEECSVRSRSDVSFQVSHRGETFNLKVGSSRLCQTWIKEINVARQTCLDANEKRRSKMTY